MPHTQGNSDSRRHLGRPRRIGQGGGRLETCFRFVKYPVSGYLAEYHDLAAADTFMEEVPDCTDGESNRSY